ncbi:MAG: hypothetical protein K8Q99_08385 [Acholeplasmataceae bacterium]|nr:hypothetical protein [Acholeplasmataceae bacterium]
MKKFFEKNPMFYYTFVLAVVSIACGVVIGGVNALTAPVIEDNLLAAKVEAFETVLNGIDDFDDIEVGDDYPSTIQSVSKGYDAADNVLGYIYEAYNTNKFGNMTIVVSVGLDGKVIGATFVAIEQTYNVPGTKENLTLYIGSDISNLAPSSDLISGATGSLTTLQALLADVSAAHSLTAGAIILDPLDEVYGTGYVLESDDAFVPTAHVIAKSLVMQGVDEVGYVYSLSGSGDYQDGTPESIVMDVYFNVNDEIVEILLPVSTYNHSGGSFKNKNITYLELFVGLSKTEIQAVIDTDHSDIVAGASNTNALINELLEAFISEVA